MQITEKILREMIKKQLKEVLKENSKKNLTEWNPFGKKEVPGDPFETNVKILKNIFYSNKDLGKWIKDSKNSVLVTDFIDGAKEKLLSLDKKASTELNDLYIKYNNNINQFRQGNNIDFLKKIVQRALHVYTSVMVDKQAEIENNNQNNQKQAISGENQNKIIAQLAKDMVKAFPENRRKEQMLTGRGKEMAPNLVKTFGLRFLNATGRSINKRDLDIFQDIVSDYINYPESLK